MPNAFASALSELAACQSAEFGTACVATIGNQTVAAVISENPFDSVILEGGVSQAGAQYLMIDKALLTDFADELNGEPPINITPTIVRGIHAFVLSVNEKDGVFYIMTGRPEAQ